MGCGVWVCVGYWWYGKLRGLMGVGGRWLGCCEQGGEMGGGVG